MSQPEFAETVRRFVARSLYRLAHRIDKIGWWVAETPSDRRIRKRSKAAALGEQSDGPGASDA